MADSGPPASNRIFISYRREETAGHAGRLYDRLASHFGDGQVFMDVHSLEGGVDYENIIEQEMASSAVVVALIGRQWLTMTDEAGRRRIDNPRDLMRLELEAALAADVRVIPVLVAGAAMPQREHLPESLEGLARRHTLRLSNETFHSDADLLLEAIERVVGRPAAVPEAPQTTHTIVPGQVASKALLSNLPSDDRLADEVDEWLRGIAASSERWEDTRCTALLTRVSSSDDAAPTEYFQAYISYRFMTILERRQFRIVCVNSKRLYDDVVANDREVFYVHLQVPTKEFPVLSQESFSVESMFVNELELEIRSEISSGEERMLFMCEASGLDALQGQSVAVEMTLKTKVQKQAHAMHLTVPRMSRRVLFAFDYGDTGISDIDVFDTFLSRRKPYIRRLPTMIRARRVEVHSDEWVLPTTGVVFIWH
jgi:TIR domain-containing protein